MDIHFIVEDWERIRRDYSAWWQGKLDRPLIYFTDIAEVESRAHIPEFYSFLTNYSPEVTPTEIVNKFIASQAHRRYPGDTFPYFHTNFGAGILSAVLGSDILSTLETVWFKPRPGANLSNLRLEPDRESCWWNRIRAVTETSVEMLGDIAQVAFTDLGGNLDILAGLIGTEPLLMALSDNPRQVHKALDRITEIWLSGYDELHSIIRRRCPGTQAWAALWAPGTMYMLQSDFSFMISPDMFKEFVVPDLESCCDHLEYSFYHLDGVGEIPHLEHLLSIERLRGIQWIPGAGKPMASEWPDLLRTIRDGGKLAEVCVDREGAKKICRELGGKGFQLIVPDALTPEEAEEFLEEIGRFF